MQHRIQEYLVVISIVVFFLVSAGLSLAFVSGISRQVQEIINNLGETAYE